MSSKINRYNDDNIYENRKLDGKILCDGTFGGYYFEIISYGTHPCCYVYVKDKNDIFYNKKNLDKMICHGGITYQEFDGEYNSWVYGWDYAHSTDYYSGVGKFSPLPGKKYTLDELIHDMKVCIYNMCIYNNCPGFIEDVKEYLCED